MEQKIDADEEDYRIEIVRQWSIDNEYPLEYLVNNLFTIFVGCFPHLPESVKNNLLIHVVMEDKRLLQFIIDFICKSEEMENVADQFKEYIKNL